MNITYPFFDDNTKSSILDAIESLIERNSPALIFQGMLLSLVNADSPDAANSMFTKYVLKITGRDSKAAKQIVAQALAQCDFDGLYFLRTLLSPKADTDFDRVMHHFKNRLDLISANELTSDAQEFMTCMWLNLRAHYPEQRCLMLVLECDNEFMFDTLEMLDRLMSKIEDFKAPKKPKGWLKLHAYMLREMPRIAMPDRSLNQREDVLHLDKSVIETDKNKFTIRVPKTHLDLVRLGQELNFCIGNGFYTDSVISGNCSIIALFNDRKPVYVIQFNRYDIMQAYGYDNKTRPPTDILRALEQKVTSQPVLPTDFLPIKDSNWVKGYKYDGSILFLLLRDRIYAYADVPRAMYEELLASDRKGTFVNQNIKKYPCKNMGYVDMMIPA